MRLVQVGGKTFMQKKKRSRKRFKMSKKHRDKLARAAKKFKFPVLTIGANAIPILNAIRVFSRWPLRQIGHDPAVQATLFNGVVSPYIGIKIAPVGETFKASFAPGELLKGLAPNVLLSLVKKQRWYQGANRLLSKLGLPVGLS